MIEPKQESAYRAIEALVGGNYVDSLSDDKDELQNGVISLIIDLEHLSAVMKIPFKKMLDYATELYHVEREETFEETVERLKKWQ